MAIIYFTNNANSGSGSLRAAITYAQPGDVIRPDETVFERGATIEIALVETLNVDKSLTLDGGSFRIRLNGGGAIRCASVAANVTATFIGVDFVSGCYTLPGGGINAPGTTNVTFERCGFYGCKSNLGGGAHTIGRTRYNDCAFLGCAATDSGGAVCASKRTTLNGVTAAGCVAASQGDSLYIVDGTMTEVKVINSILCGSVGDPPFLTTDGSVVGAPSSIIGFVASPPDDLTPETWSADAWQNWDLRLLDDASPTPSPYRDSGDVDAASKYDLDGNFRGRETDGVATCSPGAYETIQADLFWIGEPFPQAMVDAAPQNLRVSNFRQQTGSSLYEADMTWEIPDGVSYSSIYGEYSVNNGFAWRKLSDIAKDATSRIATQITPGSKYLTRLRGVFVDGSYTAWSVIAYTAPRELDGSDVEQSWELGLPSALSVVNPSFQTSAGWATSRFSTSFCDAAPQKDDAVFVDGSVLFDGCDVALTRFIVGGCAAIRFAASGTQTLQATFFDVGIGALVESTAGTQKLGVRDSASISRFGEYAYVKTAFSTSSNASFQIAPTARFSSLANAKIVYRQGFFDSYSFNVGVAAVIDGDVENVAAFSINTASASALTATNSPRIVCKSFSWHRVKPANAADSALTDGSTPLVVAATKTVKISGAVLPSDCRVDVSRAEPNGKLALTLTGQTVYGDAPTAAVKLSGSAKIDERGLDVASLALNADATLTVKNATVKTENLAATNATLIVVDSSITANDSGIEDSTLTISENETEILKASNIDISGGVVSSDFKLSIEVLDNNESGELSISEIELIADSISSAGGTITFKNSIVTANTLSFTETFSEILNSTLNFAAIHLSDSTCVLESTTVTAKSVIVNGTSTIDFTGEDSILRGAESLTLDDESRCNGVGYLVTPLDGQYFDGSQIGEDVRICDYGADVQSFSATANSATTANLDWNQSDEQPLILLETYDNGWKVLENNIGVDSLPYETTLTGAQRFRLFDGAGFLYDEAYFTVKSFYVYSISSTQKDVESLALYSKKTQIIRAHMEGTRNENILLLAQIKNLLTGEFLSTTNVDNIKASVYKINKSISSGDIWEAQDEWTEVVVEKETILEEPIMIDGWTNDDTGANFIWTPDTRNKSLFKDGGRYVVQVTFNLINDNPIVISFNVNVK